MMVATWVAVEHLHVVHHAARPVRDGSLIFVENRRRRRGMLGTKLIRDHMARLSPDCGSWRSREVDGEGGIRAVARSPQSKATAHSELMQR
jgi:hypothetical protein